MSAASDRLRHDLVSELDAITYGIDPPEALRRALYLAWGKGYNAGWDNGVTDSIPNDGSEINRNPYRLLPGEYTTREPFHVEQKDA